MTTPEVHPRDLIVGLQKGLALMQLFSVDTPRLSVPDAARLSQMTPSAARRFLLTLVHEGFVETDGRYYWLTAKALRIGQAYVDSAQLPLMLRPIVEQIARNTGEHISVGVRDGDETVHIVRSRYSHISSLSIRPGARMPLYCTATGRVWLASLPEAELEAYMARVELKALTPYTLTDAEAFRAELKRIKQQGYSTVDGEYEAGMRVLGVPLCGRNRELKAAIALTTHSSRMEITEMCQRYLTPLYEAQALLKPIIG